MCEVDGEKYENGAVIKEIDKCTKIVCHDGYPITVIDKTCEQISAGCG